MSSLGPWGADVMQWLGKTVRYRSDEMVNGHRYDPDTMMALPVRVLVVVEGVCEGFEQSWAGLSVCITGYGWVPAANVEVL